MEELSLDSLKSIDIKAIAFNKNLLGPLTFDQSAPLLEKLLKLANEFDELGYKENLSTHEVNEIDAFKNNLLEHLRRIQNFDINQPNPKETHDNYENQILNFYNDVTRQLRASLVYLRQEAQYKAKNQKELRALQQETLRARKKFQELSEQLKKEIETLEKQKERVKSKHGELASNRLANYFNKQTDNYIKSSNEWLARWTNYYKWLIRIVIGNLVLFFVIFIIGDKLKLIGLTVTEVFTLQYLFVKVALLSLLSYGLRFSSRNYSINSNLAATNIHRKNVAQTLEDYLATDSDPQIRQEIVKEGVKSMFEHLPIGYVGKDEAKDSSSPVSEVINYFFKPVG